MELMSVESIVENIRATFAMEDMHMSKDDERRVTGILSGTLSVEEAIAELDKKYGIVREVV